MYVHIYKHTHIHTPLYSRDFFKSSSNDRAIVSLWVYGFFPFILNCTIAINWFICIKPLVRWRDRTIPKFQREDCILFSHLHSQSNHDKRQIFKKIQVHFNLPWIGNNFGLNLFSHIIWDYLFLTVSPLTLVLTTIEVTSARKVFKIISVRVS